MNMERPNMPVQKKKFSPPMVGGWPRRRAGFSFTEILFAVMILGIGFIMVAAMFPVAIQQTQESLDETTAADMAKEAANLLARIGNDPSTTPSLTSTPNPTGTFPDTHGLVICPSVGAKVSPALTAGPTGTSSTTVSPFWNLIAGNLISSEDSRYAWVPFYRRGNSSGATSQYTNFAQVIIVPVLNRNTGSFLGFNANGTANAYDLIGATPPGSVASSTPYANLQGRMVSATFFQGAAPVPDAVTIAADNGPGNPNTNTGPALSPAAAANCAAPGAYLIVADDLALGNSANPAPNLPSCNGNVYQIGNSIPNIGGLSYFLSPGNDMKNARYQPVVAATPGTVKLTNGIYTLAKGQPVRCYIVGRGFNNPSGSAADVVSPYYPNGPAMDISVFSTFFRVQ